MQKMYCVGAVPVRTAQPKAVEDSENAPYALAPKSCPHQHHYHNSTTSLDSALASKTVSKTLVLHHDLLRARKKISRPVLSKPPPNSRSPPLAQTPSNIGAMSAQQLPQSKQSRSDLPRQCDSGTTGDTRLMAVKAPLAAAHALLPARALHQPTVTS